MLTTDDANLASLRHMDCPLEEYFEATFQEGLLPELADNLSLKVASTPVAEGLHD